MDSGIFLFGDRKDGKKAYQSKQGSKEQVPSAEHLGGEELGQGAENEAEDDQIGCGGVFFHRTFDEVGRQKDSADRADCQRREGNQSHHVQRVDRGGQSFINAEDEEHLRNADAGKNECDRDDDTAEELDDDAGDDGKRARAADLENTFGDQADEKGAYDAHDGIQEDGHADLFDLCRPEDHWCASCHCAEEEIARGNGNVSQRERDELGKEKEAEYGAEHELDQKKEAFLEFSFLKYTVDGSDQSVVYAEDHCHGAAGNSGDSHRAADPCAASRRIQRVLPIFIAFHKQSFQNSVEFFGYPIYIKPFLQKLQGVFFIFRHTA